MCDDTAVRWSESSSYRRNVESEIREEIYQKLLKTLDFLTKADYPELYLQGYDRAVETIRGVSQAPPETEQPQLF